MSLLDLNVIIATTFLTFLLYGIVMCFRKFTHDREKLEYEYERDIEKLEDLIDSHNNIKKERDTMVADYRKFMPDFKESDELTFTTTVDVVDDITVKGPVDIGTVCLNASSGSLIMSDSGSTWVSISPELLHKEENKPFTCKHCGAVGQIGTCEYCGSGED